MDFNSNAKERRFKPLILYVTTCNATKNERKIWTAMTEAAAMRRGQR